VSALRAKAAAWFRETPRRLALARLHGQMAALCQAEADEIAQSYAWPPREPLTPEEREEIEHLMQTADRAHDRMTDHAGPRRTSSAFYDFIFDYGRGGNGGSSSAGNGKGLR
jgi:predicted TIM-barrel fold metal-dependent hydrolase